MQRWNRILASSEALAAAIDPVRGVWDIGSLDVDMDEEEEDGNDGSENQWARVACSVDDVRKLVDRVAEYSKPPRFECDDAAQTCTLHGSHDDATVTIGFEDGMLRSFSRLDVAGRSDDSVDATYKWVTQQESALAKKTCESTEQPAGQPGRTTPKQAAEAVRRALKARRFKGVVDHLVSPKQRIELIFGVVEGSHGAVDFIEDGTTIHVVGLDALAAAMRKLQTEDMPVVDIGVDLSCSEQLPNHHCHYGLEGLGYDPSTGPVTRSIFSVVFGTKSDGSLFLREIKIRTEQ